MQGIKATNRDRVHAIWHRVVAHEGQHEPVCSEIRCCQSCFFLQLTHSSILKALPFFKPTSGQSPCPSAVRTLATAKENAPIVDDESPDTNADLAGHIWKRCQAVCSHVCVVFLVFPIFLFLVF